MLLFLLLNDNKTLAEWIYVVFPLSPYCSDTHAFKCFIGSNIVMFTKKKIIS